MKKAPAAIAPDVTAVVDDDKETADSDEEDAPDEDAPEDDSFT
jgi:hypothetical protein